MSLNLFNFNFISRLLYSNAEFFLVTTRCCKKCGQSIPRSKFWFHNQVVGQLDQCIDDLFLSIGEVSPFFLVLFIPSGSRGGWWSIFLLHMSEGRVHPPMSDQWAFRASARCSTVPQRRWTRKICPHWGLNREHSTPQANRLSYHRPINETLLQSSNAITRSRSLFRSDNGRHNNTEKCQK